MYLLYFALFAAAVLTEFTSANHYECASEETAKIDFSLPVSAADYQKVIKQGFSTNYFKSERPDRKYNPKNIEDVYARGFRNLRLRCRVDLDIYTSPYNDQYFNLFLDTLEQVVDKCLEVGVAPIISWVHHDAEADATDEDRENYVLWWTRVARRLRDKSYHLSFNLFTELGVDNCEPDCSDSLAENPDKYNQWTSEVISAIRGTGGKNRKRILILGAPQKIAESLSSIDESTYGKDRYLMVEWHDYAAGPNKKIIGKPGRRRKSRRYWSGNGNEEQRQTLKDAIKIAKDFTVMSGLPSYFGAWMPQDNKKGALNQREVINFARFFANELKMEQIPWSLNVLDDYYDTTKSAWITKPQLLKGTKLDMSEVLDNIMDAM